jgi:hypothetical protein
MARSVGSILVQRWWVVLLSVVVVALAAVFVKGAENTIIGQRQVTVVPSYAGSGSVPMEVANDSALMIGTITSWVADPDLARGVAEDAQLDAPTTLRDASRLVKVIDPSEKSGASVLLQVTGTSEGQARRAIESVSERLSMRTERYNEKADRSVRYSLIFSDLVTVPYSSPVPLTPLAGVLAGLILGAVIALLMERE